MYNVHVFYILLTLVSPCFFCLVSIFHFCVVYVLIYLIFFFKARIIVDISILICDHYPISMQ